MKGKVKWWQDARGYGFITTDDGKEVFCHYSNILGEGHKTLKEGQAVDFDIENAPKGPRAVNIVTIGGQ